MVGAVEAGGAGQMMMRNGDGFVAGLVAGVVIGAAMVMMVSPGLRRPTVDKVGEMMSGMGNRMNRMWRRGRNSAQEMMTEN